MHPILMAGVILNVLVITTIYKVWGLLLSLALAAAIYKIIARDDREANKYRGTLAAIAIIYFVACIAIVKAPWSTPAVDAAAIIMELFVFLIFAALGRR